MIVCDECEARTRQPIPADWLVVWLPEIRSWGHLCPEHRTDSGLMRPVLPPVPEASVLAPRAARVNEPLFAPAPVQPRGSDAPASAVDAHVGRDRRDAGAIRPPVDLAQSLEQTLEEAFRDELGLPKLESDREYSSTDSDRPILCDTEDLSCPEADPAKSSPGIVCPPRLIEPAPFVDVYDRPPLPRALREQTEMGWRVSGWGAA